MNARITDAILDLVREERARQNVKWRRAPGEWFDPEALKLAVLIEEVGEVGIELQPGGTNEQLKAELVQVAAVAVAWAEMLS